MKGFQSFGLAFTAAIIILAVPILGSKSHVDRQDYVINNEEDNTIFQKTPFQSDTKYAETQGEICSVFVSLSGLVVEGNKKEHIRSSVKAIGKNCNTIILSGDELNLETFEVLAQQTIIFLDAVQEENEIRKVKGLEALQTFFHIPVKSVADIEF